MYTSSLNRLSLALVFTGLLALACSSSTTSSPTDDNVDTGHADITHTDTDPDQDTEASNLDTSPSTDIAADTSPDGTTAASPDIEGDASSDVPPDAPPTFDPNDPYAWCDQPRAPQTPAPCNGHASLCERRYSDIAHAVTHNAMSTFSEDWVAPNQCPNLTQQLLDGVRGLMLDAHLNEDGDATLCHGPCGLGQRPLVEGLAEIKAFLDAWPTQVVTIIFESYISPEETLAAFEASELLSLTYAHMRGEPWPTLQKMIDQGTRLVVLTDNGGGTYPWYHDVWTLAWETHFSNATADDMTCDPNRGDPDADLFIFNHFLTRPIASPVLADEVNHNPFLLDRARDCQAASGRLPNFITVDFYTLGGLFEAVRALNGL